MQHNRFNTTVPFVWIQEQGRLPTTSVHILVVFRAVISTKMISGPIRETKGKMPAQVPASDPAPVTRFEKVANIDLGRSVSPVSRD